MGTLISRNHSFQAIAGIVALAAVCFSVGQSSPAAALSGSDFLPGYIISDAAFYDSGSMSAGDIQNFLNSKVTRCAPVAGVPCLKDYSESTYSRAAVAGRCAAYQGAASETAATILYKVSQACGISPKVLLVTLQKEQGLVTATSPSATKFKIAMGYGCPDTAACDTTYYGFYNQVYSAAKQFRTYTVYASDFHNKIGNTVVAFHPNPACVKGTVYIQNQATANLYNYTPYQPNAAALSNLRGYGDSCSSYGNRNFWVYYSDWFGSPTGQTNPYGNVDSLRTGPSSVTVAGWTIDPDTDDPINIHVYVDGAFATGATANLNRPDVGLALGHGSLHGFSATITGLAPGARQVCVYGINASFGENSLISCSSVSGHSGSPFGTIDSASGNSGVITLSGWSIDPDTTQPVSVGLQVDGRPSGAIVANLSRPDVASAYPGYGDGHGFSATAGGIAPGAHAVCLVANNQGGGADTSIWCGTVTVPGGPPFGYVDTVSANFGTITTTGWIIDPDTNSPARAQLILDGVPQQVIDSNLSRPDLAAFGFGALHGFSGSITGVSNGTHTLCVTGLNVGLGANTSVGCRSITVSSGTPFGYIDSTSVASNAATINGWAIDPDTTDPIDVHFYVDGQLRAITHASGDRPDVGTHFGMGASHGFSAAITPIASGSHKVCAYGINVGAAGPNPVLACTVVTIP